MTRREARIACMQILYTSDFNSISIDEAVASTVDGELDPAVKEFLDLVQENLEKVDELISSSLVNYTIERLNLVDKAIVRLATAELLTGKTPKKIAINEALEITKEYSDQGDHKAVSFNNRLLDSVCRSLNL